MAPRDGKMSSLRRKIKACINVAKTIINGVFILTVAVILSIALGLCVIAYHVYAPSIVLVVGLTALGLAYVNSQREDILSVVDAINATASPPSSPSGKGGGEDEGDDVVRQATPRGEQLQSKTAQTVQLAVDNVTDHVLESVEQSFYMVPAALTLAGAFVLTFKYYTLGAIVLALALTVFGMGQCVFCCTRRFVHKAVQLAIAAFMRRMSGAADETTPLVPS